MEKLTSLTQTSIISEVSDDKDKDYVAWIKQLKEEHLGNLDEYVKKNLLEQIKNFRDLWGNEIQNIMDLYKLKYDKANIF